MSLLTQAFTFGRALASISALGRSNRIVIVFDVTHIFYHARPGLVRETLLEFTVPVRLDGENRSPSHSRRPLLKLLSVATNSVCLIIRHVKRHEEGSVEVRFHRHNRRSTSAAPAMGLREMRSSLALKSAAVLSRRGVAAGTNLIQDFPLQVTTTVSPPWANAPSDSNP
jgi:hypothetical protein